MIRKSLLYGLTILVVINITPIIAIPPTPTLLESETETIFKKWKWHLTTPGEQLKTIEFDEKSELPRVYFNRKGNYPECIELKEGAPVEGYMFVPVKIYKETLISPTKRREFYYGVLKKLYRNHPLIYRISPDRSWAVVGNKNGAIEIITNLDRYSDHVLQTIQASKVTESSGSSRLQPKLVRKQQLALHEGASSDDACVPQQQDQLTPRTLFLE